MFEDFLACVDDTGLYERGRIENFTGKVASWCNYHESNESDTCDGAWGLLVEDRDTTQRTGFPFTEVTFECRVERVEKCAHDGDFKPWTCNALFVALIFDY